MSQLTKLTTNDILEKEFRTEIRGYSQSEVDEYLDAIIQDYQVFEKEITRLRKENQALHRDLNAAVQRAQTSAVPTPTTTVAPPTTRTESTQFTNYDVIKRVAQLERQVAEIEKTLKASRTATPEPVVSQNLAGTEPVQASETLTPEEIEKTLQFTFTK
ncbi:MAG: cell division regulator GpsB [Culicoidibacterales bacterium]